MDKVFIEGLQLRGRHGVYSHERENEQEFLIDIVAELDTSAAAMSDNITDTADYTKFCATARETVEDNSFYLIERLADAIARRILEDVRIARVEITIRKPAALAFGVPGVTVIRTRTS
jgi:dihydroneopterin aldolase